MQPRTVATMERLAEAAWFTHVGIKDATAAVVLSSWDEAIAHCGSFEWEDLRLEVANQLRERLMERSRERFEKWNDVVDEMKKTTLSFVRGKIETVVREHNLPKVFEDVVQWDILHVCMETEYADVYPPGFYASQAYWYVNGHFPCGWKGDFPQGMPIIY
jgi:hypothetical protein